MFGIGTCGHFPKFCVLVSRLISPPTGGFFGIFFPGILVLLGWALLLCYDVNPPPLLRSFIWPWYGGGSISIFFPCRRKLILSLALFLSLPLSFSLTVAVNIFFIFLPVVPGAKVAELPSSPFCLFVLLRLCENGANIANIYYRI